MAYESYRAYFAFLGQVGEVMEQLTDLSKKKTAAVRRDDLQTVDACMKQEQAISLRLRSMDKKREDMLAALNLTGIALKDLPDRCPRELRSEAKTVCQKLRGQYEIYRAAAQVARTTLECNLHQIEKLLADLPDAPPAARWTDIRA